MKIVRTLALTVGLFVIVALIYPALSHALEPTLLWEKQFKAGSSIRLTMAKASGDTFVLSRSTNEVIGYSRDGNEFFHWGPRIDLHAGKVDVSDNCTRISISTVYTEMMLKKLGLPWYSLTGISALFDRSGSTIFNAVVSSSYDLSPDGTYLVYVDYGKVSILDAAGVQIYADTDGVSEYGLSFSSDSGYFTVIGGVKEPGDPSGASESNRVTLRSRSGEVIFSKIYNGGSASIADNAQYVTTYPYFEYRNPERSNKGYVYDRNGQAIMEGFGFVSGNGTRLAMMGEHSVTVYAMPDKEVVTRLPVKAFQAWFSHDGRYLVLAAKRSEGEDSGSNLFVYDLDAGTSWDTHADYETAHLRTFNESHASMPRGLPRG